MRKAALIPLEYDDDLTNPGTKVRNELAITISSDDWNDLENLLDDPSKYLADARKAFNFPGAIVELWTCLKPISIILRPGRIKNEYINRFALLNEVDLTVAGGDEEDGNTDFPDGGFYAELTLETRTLTITYFRPTSLPDKPAPRFFVDGFEVLDIIQTPTISLIEAGTGLMGGTLHFDIAGGKRRGAFILNYIEDRVSLVEKVLTHTGTKKRQSTLAAEGGLLTFMAPLVNDVQSCAAEDEEPFICSEVCRPECSVCGVCSIRIDNGNYVLGSLLLKCYCPTGPG